MPDSCGDAVNCEQMRKAMSPAGALTAIESAHLDGCAACLEAWLEATVAESLEASPEVRVPAGFAARLAARLPEKSVASGARRTKVSERPWGLLTASLLVGVGLLANLIAFPAGMNTRTGSLFVALVISEIAGIGLWLGIGRSDERRN